MKESSPVKNFFKGIFTTFLLYTLWAIFKTLSGYHWLIEDVQIVPLSQYIALFFLIATLILYYYLYKKNNDMWAGAFLLGIFFILYLTAGSYFFLKVLIF